MRNLARYRVQGLIMILALAMWSFTLAAERPDKAKQSASSLDKGSGTPRWSVLTINNIWTWHRSDGEANHSPSGEDGVSYPKFTGRCVYEDNVAFGGKMYVGGYPGTGTPATTQPVRVNGGTYLSNHGMDAGWVDGFGATAVAVSPGDPNVRIYRIRRDYFKMTDAEVTEDAQIYYEHGKPGEVTADEKAAIRSQYDTDWKNWPIAKGAPYVERNGQPGFQAPPDFVEGGFSVDDLIGGSYDEPGVAGSDPGTPADQAIFTVYNGLVRTKTLLFEGSEPMGVEFQKTAFAYKRSDALGNVYFTRYRMINKGGVDIGGGTKGNFYIDSLFLCQWSDIDLGEAGDDLAGCDSLLGLAYVYNGNAVDNKYAAFKLPPPASGYDFLGGALVDAPGDSGVYDFKRVYNKTNQGLSSFAYFSAGSPYSDPDFAVYDLGTGQWWKMLRGFAPLGSIATPDIPYNHPPGAVITKFPLSGTPGLPASATNFIDGQGATWSFVPGDRRILLNTGPSRLGPGDTTDIYVGFVVGIGADRLSSVSVMKAYDKAVQETFDLVFQVAKPPKNPTVKVTELDGEILLDWSWDLVTINDTENKTVQPGAYKFEGYNLWQLPTAGSTLAEAVKIATYDLVNGVTTIVDNVFDPVIGQFVLKPVQFGTDAGLARFADLKRDYVNDVDKLYNGTPYFYAVTAYSRATLSGYTAALESPIAAITARPKVPFGKSLTSSTGDTVQATRLAGASDGSAIAFVADPLSVTGATYEIGFNANATWFLVNSTTGDTLLNNMTNQAGDDNYPIVEGIQFKVLGPPNDAKDFQHTQNPTGPINPPSYVGFSTFNSWGFPDPDPSRGGAPIADFGGGRWGIHTGGSGAGDESYATRFKPRTFRNDNFTRFVPYDFEIRFTAAGGIANLGFTSGAQVNVPFELWNIGVNTPNDPSDDIRMIPLVNDADANGAFNLQRTDHGLSGSDNDPYTDWIYWYTPVPNTPGRAGYDLFAADPLGEAGVGSEVMARMVLVNVNGGSVSDVTWPANANSVMPLTGNVLRIISTKPNTSADVYSFNTAPYAPSAGADLAKASAEKVGVFPNPYYTQNALETDKFSKFVTFNNLPVQATIRVFNLAGQLVRTLEKNDASQFFNWDLRNEKNFPIASGIYLCYVEMPETGVTKILKLAVIMEQEILDFYVN